MESLPATEGAAERLGITSARVRTLILAGRLPAQKFGHINMIRETNLRRVEERKPGRLPKAKPSESSANSRKRGASK